MALTKNRIHQGDCVQLLGKVAAESVDLVFADPPFNIGYEYDEYDDARTTSDYLQWCQQWMAGVHRVLKPNGTFWLAIGDEYAAELKIEAQKLGFHCRSWVIWYYTFGVNCVNGFSRSHTHLFHFVKNKEDFVFNRFNPQIRVQSARQLVYADNRANPNGRLPDNTWITRPQDAPLSFSPSHDTWYFARVAGTFKEREGFHGCQMPEQLLARIIRASSNPQDVVLDPFGGSGTTLCVAKKLGRQWIGFELSTEYSAYIKERLKHTEVGGSIDGPEDPIESAPSTAKGKQRKSGFNKDTEDAVIESYNNVCGGLPVEYMLCDKELSNSFVKECLNKGLGGNATVWNRYLLSLERDGRLTRSSERPDDLSLEQLYRVGYASEVAWRLLSIDYRKTLDEILCSPEFASEFDRLAALYGPSDTSITSQEFRLAAMLLRRHSAQARERAAHRYADWISKDREIPQVRIENGLNKLEVPGVFVLCANQSGLFVGESENMRLSVEQLMSNEKWQSLEPDSVMFVAQVASLDDQYALKAALVQREVPFLTCRLWTDSQELPNA
jgi:site-specific DNA-methyltransferase (adenine-specific)